MHPNQPILDAIKAADFQTLLSYETRLAMKVIFLSMMNNHEEWFKENAIFALQRLIMKKDGVESLITCLIPNGSMDLNGMEKISQLLTATPDQRIKINEYIPCIVNQLFEILNTKPSVSGFILVELMTLRKKAGKILVVDRILKPLKLYTNSQSNGSEYDLDGNIIVVTELEIQDSIRAIEQLLVGNEPSPIFVDYLIDVLHPLLALYQQGHGTWKQRISRIILSISRFSNSFIELILDVCERSVEQEVCLIKPGPAGGTIFTKSEGHRFVISPKTIVQISKESDKDIMGNLFVKTAERHMICKRNDSSEDITMYYGGLLLELLSLEGELLKDSTQIFKFIKTTIVSEDVETLHLGLVLLSNMLGPSEQGLQLTEEEHNSIKGISIIITTLLNHEDPAIVGLAKQIKLRLTQTEFDPLSTQKKSLKLFKEAMLELQDPVLPIRAHGMATLRTLILQKDTIITENIDAVVLLFIDLIGEEDSFIYLNAVKGCSALVDKYPNEALKQITNRYKDISNDSDFRTRLGESLYQIIQRSGAAFVSLSELIVNTVMVVVLQKQYPNVQSSAFILASLIASQAPQVFLPFISQLFDLCIRVLQLEKNIEVRKGVLVLLVNIVRKFAGSLESLVGTTRVEQLKAVSENSRLFEKDLIIRGHLITLLRELD